MTGNKKSPASCYFCKLNFSHKSTLFSHLQNHTQETQNPFGYQKFRCEFCPNVLSGLTALRHHLQWKHTHERPYKCLLCDQSFTTKVTLQRHKNVHSPGTLRPYPCTTCPATFKLKRYRDTHFRLIHQEKPTNRPCTQCPKIFSRISSLKFHQKVSHPKIPQTLFSCPSCTNQFDKKHLLQKHYKIVHNNKSPNSTCYFCSRTFKLPQYYFQHLLTHTKEKPYKCFVKVNGAFGQDCPFECTLSSSLKHHIRVDHKGIRHPCPFCGDLLGRECDLRGHILKVHTLERPYSCGDCGKGYISLGELRRHRNRKHIPMGKATYPCHSCAKVFLDKTNFNRHFRVIHLQKGQRVMNFGCYFCPRRLQSKGTLEMHMNTHTLERPFKCSVCEKGFPHSSAFYTHKYVHSKGPLIQCSKCQRKVKHLRALRRHIYNCHNV